MKKLDSFLEAAKLIDEGKYSRCCLALDEVEDTAVDTKLREKEFFRFVMGPSPKDIPVQTLLGVQSIRDGFTRAIEVAGEREGIDKNEFRVLLLCMMSACQVDFLPSYHQA